MTPVKSPWMEHPASQRNLLLSTGPTPLMHDTHVKPTIAPPPLGLAVENQRKSITGWHAMGKERMLHLLQIAG